MNNETNCEREDETADKLPEISSRRPRPPSHMPDKKRCKGRGRISQKRSIKFIPVSTNRFLAHWFIVFYLGLSHSPLNGPALAPCLFGTAAKWNIVKAKLWTWYSADSRASWKHHHLQLCFVIRAHSLWSENASLLYYFMSLHNLNNYVTGDSLSLFHYLLSQYFLMLFHHQTSNSTCQYFICPSLCGLN